MSKTLFTSSPSSVADSGPCEDCNRHLNAELYLAEDEYSATLHGILKSMAVWLMFMGFGILFMSVSILLAVHAARDVRDLGGCDQ